MNYTKTEVTIFTQSDLQWQGMVTARVDGMDIVLGMFGSVESADYYAKKMIKSGKYKGVRAWSCIGEYGDVPKDKLSTPEEEVEDEVIETPDPTCSLDKWFE